MNRLVKYFEAGPAGSGQAELVLCGQLPGEQNDPATGKLLADENCRFDSGDTAQDYFAD
jgi:hypothetical protein